MERERKGNGKETTRKQNESSVSTRLFLSSFRSLSSLTVSLRLHSLPLAVGTTRPSERGTGVTGEWGE